MTPAQSQAGAIDLLTRTTLQMDENLSPTRIAQTIAALRRVPGVLLAEIGVGTTRAIVAHDAAVSSATLLEAAAQTGVQLKFVADTRVPASAAKVAQPLAGIPVRRVLVLAAALIFVPAFISLISPHVTGNQVMLPILLACMWAFIFARAMFSRRP